MYLTSWQNDECHELYENYDPTVGCLILTVLIAGDCSGFDWIHVAIHHIMFSFTDISWAEAASERVLKVLLIKSNTQPVYTSSQIVS